MNLSKILYGSSRKGIFILNFYAAALIRFRMRKRCIFWMIFVSSIIMVARSILTPHMNSQLYDF